MVGLLPIPASVPVILLSLIVLQRLLLKRPVSPAVVVVEADKSVTFKNSYDKKSASFSGAISGATVLTKRGKGTLTLNDGNSYTGGTILEAVR